MERLNSGDFRSVFGTILCNLNWSDEKWKSRMAKGRGSKKRFQYCTDPSGKEYLYLRALQGHSGRNPTDPTLQAINLHSITNSGLIPGGQILNTEIQTKLTWKHRVLRGTIRKSGRHIKTLCIGST